MKKYLALLLILMIVLIGATALATADVDWGAIIDSGGVTPQESVTQPAQQEAAVAQTQPFDWTDIITKIVVWIIGGVGAVLSSLLVKATKQYIYPWLCDVAIPWLKERRLLDAAKTAVNYAEAELGRHTGEDKWLLAETALCKKGYNFDSSEVVEALKSAWNELNITQIAAGIKEASNDAPDPQA